MLYHKKGEHVFNNFVSTIRNSQADALRRLQREFPHADESLWIQFRSEIGNIETHPLIRRGRELVAPPTGVMADPNSARFGIAVKSFREAIVRLVESILSNAGNPDTFKGHALRAWQELTAGGIDLNAFRSALSRMPPAECNAAQLVYEQFRKMMTHEFPVLGRHVVTSIAVDVTRYVQAHR